MNKMNEMFNVILEGAIKSKTRKKTESKTEVGEGSGLEKERSVDETNYSESDENNEECSVSSADDNINLQFDGKMKTAPEYLQHVHSEEKVEKNENELLESPWVIKGQALNVRPLDQCAKTYQLETFDKNFLMIFNQENFINYERRTGTVKDVQALKTTLSKYNFECHDYHDLTKDEIMEKLKTFDDKNFTDYGCVAVAVLTHGNKDGLLRAKDREFSEMEIINYFKTHDKPTLVTKPKLLIIQACRGVRLTPGVPVMRSHQLRLDRDAEVEPYTLPVEADMLVLHSSYIGCPSVRDVEEGSWFIQTLCKKIDELGAELDLESILIEVKRDVAIDAHYDQYNRTTFEVDVYKQMPVVTSTLIRKLYLTEPKKDQTTSTDETLQTYLDGPQTQRSSVSDISYTMRLSGQCACHLHHFAYLRMCLSYFLEENPGDEVAQSYLEISSTFDDTTDFSAPKDKMAKAICNHFRNNATNNEYYKYIYMQRH